jgi:hypothetical protein
MYGEVALSSFAVYAAQSQFTAEALSTLRLRRGTFAVPIDWLKPRSRI